MKFTMPCLRFLAVLFVAPFAMPRLAKAVLMLPTMNMFASITAKRLVYPEVKSKLW